ncbi:MAG: Rrf2 family transcriptional regulator [Alphaproteobacteria bacterium]|nr:Rrf2 family transcriptional regulator [Alphaproteobacteria bacterium]NCQ66455.1 Rrf2 family transcriptional regulator [Alphaproteobacteria bacterium]
MKLSTKARYAVIALVDLAQHDKRIDGKIKPSSLLDISQRQSLSQHYLEQLFNKLRRAGIVESMRGQSGGYFLSVAPADITISQIVNAVDEPIRSTKCDPASDLGCQGKQSKCLAHSLWIGLENNIRSYLTSVTLNDVITQRPMPLTVMTRPFDINEQEGNIRHAC